MAIQIGKYKRPGIFLEEFNNSVISTPIVEGITNMVIGVSKKGPVNTPVRITSVNDLEAIFGQLDRGLERKGSFFHRTISKMLENSPVYAINLLLTDDTLDVIEYKSISASSDFANDIKREGAYRRFFDTTGFWKRDTEAFINLTKNNSGYSERAFSLTNLSDRFATVFVVKTSLTGFDRTLIEWYGSMEKVPTYVNSIDWASDYMVDVLVVAGDWSNYQDLAIDSRWSAYFNTSGLIKDQIRNFSNDRNVTTLAYYEGLSLIPYFRDANGRNIFIETTINRDTDKTGIFCAFNNDLVEVDFFNGELDLIGHTIASKNETNIEFLSYKETIAEQIELSAKPLDLPGNVTGLLGTFSDATHAFESVPKPTGFVTNPGNRTSHFAEGIIYGVTLATYSVATSSISLSYASTNGYAVIGGNHIPLTTASASVLSTNYVVSSVTQSYVSTAVLDSTGVLKFVNSSNSSNPTVASTDLVLAYYNLNVCNGEIKSATKTDVTLATTGFVNLTVGTASGKDYYVTDLGSGSIKVTFKDTNSTANVKDYNQYRRFKMFNSLVDLIDNTNKDLMTMLLNRTTFEKVSLASMTISDIVTSTTENKSFVLNTGLTTLELSDVLGGGLIFYTNDNEFILGTKGVRTRATVATASYGVAAKYSSFYTKFYDGTTNTGDFFYGNRIPSTLLVSGGSYSTVTFFNGESDITGLNTGSTSSFAGYDYIAFTTTDPEFSINDIILLPSSTKNVGTFTIMSDNLAGSIGSTLGAYVYQVNESATYEELTQVTIIYDYNKKHYLKMYLDNDSNLIADFMDVDLSASEPTQSWIAGSGYTDSILSANTFFIQSADSNYKQTIEIELPTSYVEIPNKILVNSSRYTEVKIGDFLEAFYDSSLLEIGEAPRKLTRITSKKVYSGDSSLVEITCDSRIKKTSFGGDYQTMRYKSVDSYASTYKAISLKGFRVREASLPDGTETRQNTILNLVAKGTPLFKATTNKESFDFRYLIDSFGLGLAERSKQQLVDICGERLDAFGFINMPSMKSFKNSTSPSFVNAEGVLQVEFIAKGGDPESSPAFLYSFADGDGTTCAGYFTPYLTVDDNGRPLSMPPASHVASTYMRKHNSNIGGITAWTIAAGVTNGRITNIAGLEMEFDPSDIEFLNGAQMNPIVFKRNRGNIIETENTAQTLFKSALSYIHVREVLIELERELSRMLLDFQWKFNTPDIRSEIKLRADVICETYVSKNGLYNYFNKMDEENNTDEIIDNQIGVLDTYVEPIKGMGIIVNNVTILRTGAINAGGFQ